MHGSPLAMAPTKKCGPPGRAGRTRGRSNAYVIGGGEVSSVPVRSSDTAIRRLGLSAAPVCATKHRWVGAAGPTPGWTGTLPRMSDAGGAGARTITVLTHQY